jgi:hypothetical protein
LWEFIIEESFTGALQDILATSGYGNVSFSTAAVDNFRYSYFGYIEVYANESNCLAVFKALDKNATSEAVAKNYDKAVHVSISVTTFVSMKTVGPTYYPTSISISEPDRMEVINLRGDSFERLF